MESLYLTAVHAVPGSLIRSATGPGGSGLKALGAASALSAIIKA